MIEAGRLVAVGVGGEIESISAIAAAVGLGFTIYFYLTSAKKKKVPIQKNIDFNRELTKKIDALKKVLENKEASSEEIKKPYDELSSEIQKVGAEMYKTAQAEETKKKDEEEGVKVTEKGKESKEGEKEKEKEEAVEAEVVKEKEKGE